MSKLSEHMPDFSLSTERGWLRRLAQQVEAQDIRPHILEGKHKKQAPVDRQLVEEALEVAVREQKPWPTALWPASRFGEIVRLLRLALEGDSDA